jgi:hypothetical protein
MYYFGRSRTIGFDNHNIPLHCYVSVSCAMSMVLPGFYWGSCCQIFSFLLEFCKSLFCSFSFAHCVVCPSSISGVWLPFCHLQTLLKIYCAISMVISFQFSLTNISNHNDITEVLLTVVFIPIILKSSYFLKHYCRNKNVDFKCNAHEAFLE